MLLPTDGIEEAVSPENIVFGVERILPVARAHSRETASGILDGLFAAVRNFSEGLPQLDDLTLVVVKVKGPA